MISVLKATYLKSKLLKELVAAAVQQGGEAVRPGACSTLVAEGIKSSMFETTEPQQAEEATD